MLNHFSSPNPTLNESGNGLSRLIFKTITDYAIIALDIDGRVLAWNRGAESLLGYPEADALGLESSKLFTREDLLRGLPGQGLEEASLNGRHEENGWRVRRDGTRFWANDVVLRLENDGSGSARYVRTIRDLTAQAERESLLKAMLDQAAVGIALLGPGGSWLDLNQGFSRFLGYSPEELRALPAHALIPREDLPEESRLVRLMLAGGIPGVQCQKRFIRKDGALLWALCNLSPVHDPDTQRIRHLLLVLQEVTELKHAENMRAHFLALSHMDLQQLKHERELREKFVTTLSHDLRNPLCAAKINAQLLLGCLDKPASRERIAANLLANVDRADRMIEDLLDANRIRAGQRLPIRISCFDLRLLAKDTLDELSVLHGDRFVIHEMEPTASRRLEGYWCRTGLRRVIENLCTNAIKYGFAHTPITLSLKRQEGSVSLSIQNRGAGLTSEEQAKVFDPFQRTASAELGAQKGWGLGLTLVRGIVEAHGGAVCLQSEPGEQTTFTVELPLDARSQSLP